MAAEYSLVVAPPTADSEYDSIFFQGKRPASSWHAEVGLDGSWDKVHNVIDVARYVATKVFSREDLVTFTDTGNTVRVLKGDNVVIALSRDPAPASLKRGICVMLAQYLAFVLDNGGLTMYAGVQTMFEFFAGAKRGPLDELQRYKDCLSGFNLSDNTPRAKRLVTMKTEMGSIIGSQDSDRAGVYLASNLSALQEFCVLANLEKGYLQVYVRSRPDIDVTAAVLPKYNKLYGGGTDGKCTVLNVLQRTPAGAAVKLSICGQDAGSYSAFFKGVTMNSNEDVAERLALDMQGLADGENVAVFGYGYSGSGKTYTLLGDEKKDEKGAIAMALAKLKGLTGVKIAKVFFESVAFSYSTGSSKKIDITGAITELYPDNMDVPVVYMDKFAAQATPSTQTRRPKLVFTPVEATSSVGNGDFATSINTLISEVASVTATYHRRRFRIRPTPNNPQSSRVHTYYQFELTFGDNNPERTSMLTIVDMAGRESPLQILADFKRSSLSETLADLNMLMTSKLTGATPENTYATMQDVTSFEKEPDQIKNPRQYATLFSSAFLTSPGGTTSQKDVSQRLAALALNPEAPWNPATATKYKLFIQTGVNIERMEGLKVNAFTGFNPMADSERTYPLFNVYGSDTAVVNKEYGTLAPLFYTKFHIACTVVEGFYIKESLNQLVEYFHNRINNATVNPKWTAPPDDNDSGVKINVKAATKSILQRLQVDGTRFIMMAHVRLDKPEGTHMTMEFAREVSAYMPRR